MKTGRLWFYHLITALIPETRFFGLKVAMLRWCGAKIGSNVRISSSAQFFGGGELEIGDDVWVGSGCFIHPVNNATIKIGNCCDIGPQVMILTGSHEIDVLGSHIAGKGTSADVMIGDGCWLGARSIVLPGISLACKTLVAACAVITENPSNECLLMAGVPATIKRSLKTKDL